MGIYSCPKLVMTERLPRRAHPPRNDAHFVILNEVKNPLEADKRQRTQRIASEEILRVAQDDRVCERDCHGLFQASQ